MRRHFALMLWFPEEMTAGTNQHLPGKQCCYFFSHGSGLRSRRKLQVSICEEWNLSLGDVTFKKQGARSIGWMILDRHLMPSYLDCLLHRPSIYSPLIYRKLILLTVFSFLWVLSFPAVIDNAVPGAEIVKLIFIGYWQNRKNNSVLRRRCWAAEVACMPPAPTL